ncbi:MAG TPA: thioredoxin-like domain-containing protein [Chthoniobacterales bacterium]|jgi:thiol-disulfide isomerase/thioredoxin|nr:thioredoxin-like domain-containing protein [Chthoniobacterales bacterium]
MRRWVYPAFFIAAATLFAAPLPLTVSEIGLMLRTGYSSETLMQELGKRHFADTLDPTKEQTLIKAGASAELIDKLKSGIYSLSAEKTAAVQEQMATEAQHRASQADASRRSDAAYQAEVLKKRTTQSPSLNTGGTLAISEFLKHDLVQIKHGSAAHADETALENKKLIAFYFSAEWCGPCRKFTPQLVDYYKRVAPEHPEFEIVFYSSDRSQYAMEKYMLDESMPWLAIDFAKLKDKEVLKKNAGNGIPSLVLVDSMGNIISSSYADGKFRGPQQVLADLDAIFAGKAPGRLVSAK